MGHSLYRSAQSIRSSFALQSVNSREHKTYRHKDTIFEGKRKIYSKGLDKGVMLSIAQLRGLIASSPLMSNNKRVLNITRGFTLKHKQACRAVEQCSAEWVEFGVSIRDLTLAESIAKRNIQAKERDPLPYAEIPGLIYQTDKQALQNEIALSQQANQYFQQVTA